MNYFFLLFSVISLALCIGCSPSKPEEIADHASHLIEETSFNPGKGLSLSQAAKQTINLKAEEVTSQKIVPQKTMTAHIYRQAGEPISNGKTHLKCAYATASLLPAEAIALQPGQKIELVHGEKRWEGIITTFDRQMESLTGQIEILMEIMDPNHLLVIGSSLTGYWNDVSSKTEERVILPKSAVLETTKGSFVYVDNNGFFIKTAVSLSPIQGARVQILDGVYEGDTVVVEGASDLWLMELQFVNSGKSCCEGH